MGKWRRNIHGDKLLRPRPALVVIVHQGRFTTVGSPGTGAALALLFDAARAMAATSETPW
jgi:hypothetical protein